MTVDEGVASSTAIHKASPSSVVNDEGLRRVSLNRPAPAPKTLLQCLTRRKPTD
jgi:hypothetical protein